MRTIWKFPVTYGQLQRQLPRGAEIVRFADQAGGLCVWAIVDTEAPLEWRYFQLCGTGHQIGFEYNKHVGSCEQGPFVWHLFENTIPS